MNALELPLGILAIVFGLEFGSYSYDKSISHCDYQLLIIFMVFSIYSHTFGKYFCFLFILFGFGLVSGFVMKSLI